MLLESIGYQATAAAAGGTAGTPFTNDNLTVKNAREGSRVWIIALWGKNQTLGAQQLVWPSAHDVTRGYRYVAPANKLVVAQALGTLIPINRQELIASTIVGTAVAGDIEQGIITLWYEDMPGQHARLITYDELMRFGTRQTTIQASIDPGVAGNWGGSEAINADTDLLRANTDYALLGGNPGLQITAIGFAGPDSGNARVAIPGDIDMFELNQRWFVELSRATGLPCIPVFNSANKGSTNFTLADDENGAATTFQVNLVELSAGAVA